MAPKSTVELLQGTLDILVLKTLAWGPNHGFGIAQRVIKGAHEVLMQGVRGALHMADDLKTTGKGNLFVIFGEPDIKIQKEDNGRLRVKVLGVDVFDPTKGEVRSDSAEGRIGHSTHLRGRARGLDGSLDGSGWKRAADGSEREAV